MPLKRYGESSSSTGTMAGARGKRDAPVRREVHWQRLRLKAKVERTTKVVKATRGVRSAPSMHAESANMAVIV